MGGWRKTATAAAVLAAAMLVAAPLAAASSRAAAQSVAGSADQAHACGVPAAHDAACGAIQLLFPTANWHPGPNVHAAKGKGGGGSGGTTAGLPSSGYYPGDLQSAYGLASAAAAMGPGKSAPTVAIVDAYNDPYAATDLAAYRASLSGATDSNTGITDAAIPPLCSTTTTTGCVQFTKVNQSGRTSYPQANTGWSEEISVDLDMISAICPDCNIVLVEASSASFPNLAAAVSYAKSLSPAAITNSYGGSEFSSESTYNSIYTAGTSTAVTVASGDSGYGVEFPAASPGVTAVGGTALTYSGSGWNPQAVWSTAGSGCSAYEAMPSWQKDTSVYYKKGDCNGRQVADVAAVADPSTGVAVYDTYHEPGWMVFGGTSVSAQIIGGVYGLAAGSGSFRPSSSALYPDPGTTSATGPTPGLAPVTSGSNGSCGDYLCNAADRLSSGYNGPTGLGTPYGVGAFVTSVSTSPGGFGLSASPTSATVTQGSATSYTVTVTPSGGFNGSVALSVSGVPSGATPSFSPTSASSSSSWSSTLTVTTTSSTTTGSYTLTITGTSSGVPSQTTDVTLNVQAPQTTGSMTVTVAAGTSTQKGPYYHVPLTVSAKTSTTAAIAGAAVSLDVFAGSMCSGTPVATGTGTTGTNGTVTFTYKTRTAGTWCAKATVTATGYNPASAQATFST